MAKKDEFVISESHKELQKWLRKQQTLRGEKRIRSLILIKSSRFNTRQQLADSLGIHIRTLERWVKSYKIGGIEELLFDLPKNKRSKIITPSIHKGIKEKLNDSIHPLQGYKDAQQWIGETYGVTIKYDHLRKYLIHHFGTKIISQNSISGNKITKIVLQKST